MKNALAVIHYAIVPSLRCSVVASLRYHSKNETFIHNSCSLHSFKIHVPCQSKLHAIKYLLVLRIYTIKLIVHTGCHAFGSVEENGSDNVNANEGDSDDQDVEAGDDDDDDNDGQ